MNRHAILFLLALGLAQGAADGAVINYMGADTTTNDAWRTTDLAKPLDIDADNVYGTDGYVLYGSGQPSASPSYVSVTQAAGTSYFPGNASYVFLDNAALTGPAPVPNVMSGVVYRTSAGEGDLISVALSQTRNIRVGVITDNTDYAAISPSSLRIRQTAGGTADTGLIAASADRDRDGDYYFFDIQGQAGDVYVVSGVNDPGHGSNGLYGLTFDTIGTPPPPPQPTEGLWNVDFEGATSFGGNLPITMTGTLRTGSPVDQWNAFRLPTWAANITNPSLALKDAAGNATPVTLQITGTVSGVNIPGSNNLVRDYLVTHVGPLSTSIEWTLSGLTPGAEYMMWNYSGELTGRQFNMAVDMDGDGSLLDETPVLVDAAGVLFSDIVADASGMIHGRMTSPDGNEDNWAGFQLLRVAAPVPEPATLTLLGIGLLVVVGWRRRRRAA